MRTNRGLSSYPIQETPRLAADINTRPSPEPKSIQRFPGSGSASANMVSICSLSEGTNCGPKKKVTNQRPATRMAAPISTSNTSGTTDEDKGG